MKSFTARLQNFSDTISFVCPSPKDSFWRACRNGRGERRGEAGINIWIIISAFLLLTSGCASIKGYEKMYLSNEEMQLREKTIEQFEINVETYREGASGANGGQTGGGCGCN